MALNFEPKKKRHIVIFTLFIAAILIFAGLWFYVNKGVEMKKPRATMDDLLNSHSERSGSDPGAVVVAWNQPYLVLSSTPVALYYDGLERHTAPLLVAGHNPDTGESDTGPSKSVACFLDAYSPTSILGIGPIPMDVGTTESVPADDPEEVSIELATAYWKYSDGAILVKPDMNGYSLAVNAVPLACYLDIPVIITEKEGKSVDNTLNKLGVKYTLLCGDLPGYGKIWPFRDKEEIQAVLATGYPDSEGVMRSIITDRVELNASYIAMANPMDIVVPNVVASFQENFTGEVTHSDTGSTSFPTSSADAPTFYLEIPEDYRFARVIVDSQMLCVTPQNYGTPESQGERSYVYFGIDSDKDGVMVGDSDTPEDTLQFMAPSLAFKYTETGSEVYCVGHTDYPIFNSTGEKCIQIKASLDYKVIADETIPGPGIIRDNFKSKTTFTITVTVQKLDGYNYPRLVGGSALAPYLASFRGGLVLASSEYGIHDQNMINLPNCGDPAVNGEIFERINEKTLKVKGELNNLLGALAGVDGDDWSALAEKYGTFDPSSPMFLGIVADPYMVPWFYYKTTGQEEGEAEGFGTPSDNGYSDIDLDAENQPLDLDGSPPDYELAVGRMTGWDTQDTSALLARTFFYNDILDTFNGHGTSWKDSAITSHGDKVPVGAAATVVAKLALAMSNAGFSVDATHNFARSDSKVAGPIFEESNFMFACAHGFYYWFVPPGYKGTGPGGGFHVANVRDMDFGPGVLFASSCVTGKIDGIPLYNALSQTFIHSGLNAYVGASRLSWGTFVPAVGAGTGEAFGDYLALLMYGYLTGYLYDKSGGLQSSGVGDLTMGAALMMAKNDYSSSEGSDSGGAVDDTLEEFNLHGDPAFNPYEPNHNQ